MAFPEDVLDALQPAQHPAGQLVRSGNGSGQAQRPGKGRAAESGAEHGSRAGSRRGAANGTETRAEQSRGNALRDRLHGYAIDAVALVAVLIALAASNTAKVKVDWLTGSSRVSLVWLVLAAALLGWGLGLMSSARFHWRPAPRRPQRRAQA